jgi:hypothetical protein
MRIHFFVKFSIEPFISVEYSSRRRKQIGKSKDRSLSTSHWPENASRTDKNLLLGTSEGFIVYELYVANAGEICERGVLGHFSDKCSDSNT